MQHKRGLAQGFPTGYTPPAHQRRIAEDMLSNIFAQPSQPPVQQHALPPGLQAAAQAGTMPPPPPPGHVTFPPPGQVGFSQSGAGVGLWGGGASAAAPFPSSSLHDTMIGKGSKVEKAGLLPSAGSSGYMTNLSGLAVDPNGGDSADAKMMQYSPATIVTRRLHEATLEKIRRRAAERAAEAHVNTWNDDDKTDEGKRMKRLALNRLAASRSRERKKLYVQSLEDRVLELTREIYDMKQDLESMHVTTGSKDAAMEGTSPATGSSAAAAATAVATTSTATAAAAASSSLLSQRHAGATATATQMLRQLTTGSSQGFGGVGGIGGDGAAAAAAAGGGGGGGARYAIEPAMEANASQGVEHYFATGGDGVGMDFGNGVSAAAAGGWPTTPELYGRVLGESSAQAFLAFQDGGAQQ